MLLPLLKIFWNGTTSWSYYFIIFLVEYFGRNFEKPLFTHREVHELKFWLVVVVATAEPRHSAMFSATLQSFLPCKLGPLGFSLPGQLRVAS